MLLPCNRTALHQSPLDLHLLAPIPYRRKGNYGGPRAFCWLDRLFDEREQEKHFITGMQLQRQFLFFFSHLSCNIPILLFISVVFCAASSPLYRVLLCTQTWPTTVFLIGSVVSSSVAEVFEPEETVVCCSFFLFPSSHTVLMKNWVSRRAE